MSTIVTRSGKGSPLTHAEVDSNFTNLNTDKLELSGGTLTGTLNFGDNVKAQFGASADLQVFHSPAASTSYVRVDDVTQKLELRGGSEVILGYGTEKGVRVIKDGAVQIRYDDSTKLATTSTGIDVTGTVSADEAVYVQGSTPRVQIQDTDGTSQFSLLQQQGSDFFIRSRNNTADGGIIFAGYDGASTTNRMYIAPSGDISFYEDTGTTAKFFWDASTERLGIGTTSPATKLDVSGDASITNSGHFLVGKTARDSTNTVGAELKDTGEVMATVDGAIASYLNRKTSDGDILQFRKDNTAVGAIGVAAGDNIYIAGSTGGTKGIYLNNTALVPADTGGAPQDDATDIGSSTHRFKSLYLSATANVNTVDFGNWTITESGGSLYFATGGTNKMKLDASGNLQVVGSVDANATIT